MDAPDTGQALFVPPLASVLPEEGRVELCFAREPECARGVSRVSFSSEVELDFVGTRLSSVDVLDTPDLLCGVTARVPCIAWDTGWAWIDLMDGVNPTRHWTGAAEVSVTVGGATLLSVRLDLQDRLEL